MNKEERIKEAQKCVPEKLKSLFYFVCEGYKDDLEFSVFWDEDARTATIEFHDGGDKLQRIEFSEIDLSS
jgi:hypothetical protein